MYILVISRGNALIAVLAPKLVTYPKHEFWAINDVSTI